MIAYSTKQRTSEFGLRAALRADPATTAGMIVREGAALALAGIAIGLPAGLVGARLIRGQLFGVSTVDTPSLVVAVGVLVAAAVTASSKFVRSFCRSAGLLHGFSLLNRARLTPLGTATHRRASARQTKLDATDCGRVPSARLS